jgi:hypothetical protein
MGCGDESMLLKAARDNLVIVVIVCLVVDGQKMDIALCIRKWRVRLWDLRRSFSAV